MNTFMSAKVASLSKWSSAYFTVVRFVASVNKHMLGEVAFQCEWYSIRVATIEAFSPVWICLCRPRMPPLVNDFPTFNSNAVFLQCDQEEYVG